MNRLGSKDFWKKGFVFTFALFCFTVGVGKLNLKEYGIPLSFGGNLGNLLFWPLVFALGQSFISKDFFFRRFCFPLTVLLIFFAWIGSASLFHESNRDGTATLIYFLVGLGTFFLTLYASEDSTFLKKILLCLILGMAVTVLRGALDYFFSAGKFSLTGSADRRLFTPFGHPNFLGGALLLILPFAWTFDWKSLCERSGRFLGMLVTGVLFLGLLFSYSRSAWMGVSLSVFCFLLFRFRDKAAWGGMILILIIAAVLWGTSFSKSQSTNPVFSRLRSFLDFKNDPNVIERIFAWKTAVSILRDHKMTGIGPGNERFQKEFTQKREPESMLLMPHAHNVLLQMAVVFGIPGLLLFASLWGGGILSSWCGRSSGNDFSKSLRIASLCSFAGFFVYSLTDCPIFADRVSPLFWALVGLSYHKDVPVNTDSR